MWSNIQIQVISTTSSYDTTTKTLDVKQVEYTMQNASGHRQNGLVTSIMHQCMRSNDKCLARSQWDNHP